MARYIDADALLAKLPDDLPYKASVKRVLTQAHTADVVPKSEVDLYRRQVDELEDELSFTYDKLEDTKAEVAMDILAELAKAGMNESRYPVISAIKNKYTEDKAEKDCLCPRCREKKNNE
jgi:hypothetical protein